MLHKQVSYSLLCTLLCQASSDLSVLDFDIPFSIGFVAAGSIEFLAAIGVVAFVTWQVLIVAILALLGVKYIQVCSLFSHLFLLFTY